METPQRYRINTSSFAHYWSTAVGAELLTKLGFRPEIENAEKYIPYLFEADEPADQLVQSLHMQSNFKTGQQLIEAYLHNPLTVSPAERKVIADFMSGIDVTPDWLDEELLKAGTAFSQRSSLSGLVVLRDYCLMGGFESAAINKPLIYTGALKKGAVKRLADTVQFWVDLTGENALQYGNIGFLGIMKTRMIHSFARINILSSTDWDSSKWGVPLNAWDMLATNLGFSLVYLTGLRQMGITPLDNEVKGIFHFWKYVGYLLGIPLNLLPDNEKEAIEALYYWTMTQADGDEDSRAMAYALQQEPISSHHPATAIGRYFMREVHLYYNHLLLGDYSCKLLGLDRTRIGKVAYLNVLKNRWDNSGLQNKKKYDRMIKLGRRVHERVRDIYTLDKPKPVG